MIIGVLRDIKAGMVDGGMCLCEVLEWRLKLKVKRGNITIKIVEIGNPKSKKKTSSLFRIFDRSYRAFARSHYLATNSNEMARCTLRV